MDLNKILNILENKEYTEVEIEEVYVAVYYQIYTKNGGMIRILHYNKVLFSKERFEILLFIPSEEAPVKSFTIKSDSEYFKRVNDAWNQCVLECTCEIREDVESYF